ncbi:MAG TPA: hypothetical protein VJB99_02010 [Patescibacteria group bacterium]|nr:hypothetical protein [Patescibacteria group bacterium]
MEKNVHFKTKGGYQIYGTLKIPKKSAKNLVIFAHGLSDHRNTHLIFNGSKYFQKKGWTSFRFDFYSGEKGGRKLQDVTLRSQTEDLEKVVVHFQKDFEKIFVIGHSLACPSILQMNLNQVAGVILLEPSTRLSTSVAKKFFPFSSKFDCPIFTYGSEILLGKNLLREWVSLPKPKELVKDMQKPILIVSAGRGSLKKSGREYFQTVPCFEKKFFCVVGATHCFDEEGTEETIFEEAFKFLSMVP